MKRIARPVSEAAAAYTVVVVGSGYGGGIAASRLARAGQHVCVLERGAERIPGEYPGAAGDLRGEVQIDTSHGHIGPVDAMFDVRVNDEVTAIVGCGLGGTSLINAGVTLEMRHELFETEGWPRAFSADPELLSPYEVRARRMLDASPYPADRPPLRKVEALEQAAQRVGGQFHRPPIAVNFVDQVNRTGVYQPACNGCGDCCSGCNRGSKNTTLMNYLPDAHAHGAAIFTHASVRWVERADAGWLVHLDDVAGGREHPRPQTIRADVVVLAAGTLGSTEILTRSRDRGLALSPKLGHGFSGNGDVLAFSYDSYWREEATGDGGHAWSPIHGVGVGDRPTPVDAMPGPCIAGLIDLRDDPDVRKQLVVEEGVIPSPLAGGLAPLLAAAEAISVNPFASGIGLARTRVESAIALARAMAGDPKHLAEQAYQGPVDRTQTYLVMSIDDADGRLELVDDRLRIRWPGVGREAAFGHDDAVLREVNAAVHGQLFSNPLWTDPLDRQVVTVHPVGGCRMADHFADGVVDDRCRVHAGPGALHPGLYVCDGSVIPAAVGINPLLTISAIAERAVELLARDRGWEIDQALADARPVRVPPAVPPGRRAPVTAVRPGIAADVGRLLAWPWREVHGRLAGVWARAEHAVVGWLKAVLKVRMEAHPERYAPAVSFRETMEGHVSTRLGPGPEERRERISDRFEVARARGEAAGTTIDFELTLSTDDLVRTAEAPDRPMRAEGTVTCPVLSDAPMTVAEGRFSLLPPDPDEVESWLMVYDLTLARRHAGALRFLGRKHLRQRPGSSAWTDLTTLFVTISDPAADETVAEGIMTLDLQDAIQQASTLRVTPKRGWFARWPRIARAVELWSFEKLALSVGEPVLHAYTGLLADLVNFPAREKSQLVRRRIRAPEPEPVTLTTRDDFTIKLTRYRGGEKGPVVLAPGFSVLSSSFAVDTVDENVVEHLCSRGYDVWLFAYRGSPDSGSSTRTFAISDIAKHDWPTAIDHIHRSTGKDVQVVAHCVSSMTLLMALLEGMPHVRSVISSQLTLHPVVNWLNYLKADLDVVPLLRRMQEPEYEIDLRQQIDMRSVPLSSTMTKAEIGQKIIDAAMWFVPVPEGERCKNPVCHRVFAIFGPSYAHAQLNHATHTVMDEMFGPIATGPFEDIVRIVEAGHPVDADGRAPDMDQVARLRLPIDFIAGNQNQEFLPETSARTLQWLVANNGPDHYTRKVFEGYAHMDFWIGKDAAVDVFPYVAARLDQFN